MGNKIQTKIKLENLYIPSDVDYTYINNHIVPAYLLYKKTKLYPINTINHDNLFGMVFTYANSKHNCSIVITTDMCHVELLQLLDVYHSAFI